MTLIIYRFIRRVITIVGVLMPGLAVRWAIAATHPTAEDTPDEVVLEGLREGLQEALAGRTIPVSQMWDGVDAE